MSCDDWWVVFVLTGPGSTRILNPSQLLGVGRAICHFRRGFFGSRMGGFDVVGPGPREGIKPLRSK